MEVGLQFWDEALIEEYNDTILLHPLKKWMFVILMTVNIF